jgi:hypothetical protein
MEKIKLTFEVVPTMPDAALGFETWLDNQLMFDTDHLDKTQQIVISLDDTDAEHELKLVLKNKNFEHTRLNSAGEIESDAMLEIRNLAFDDIPVGQIVTEQTVYTHNFNGTAELIQDQFFGVMGCNGTVTLKFTTPMYLWFLENM